MADQSISKKDVKDYWESNTPQYWYSESPIESKDYYEEIQRVRYSLAYPYLRDVAEFNDHSGERVLEIGCGQGTDLLQYALGGARVTGIDLTENAIEKSRVMFAAYELDAELKTCDAETLESIESDSMDLVYSFGVLHHTPNTEAAIASVNRVLKPGGKAIVMLYGKGLTWMLAFLYWYLFKGEFLKSSFKNSLSRHAEHVEGCPLAKYYSKSECRELFEQFADVQVEQLHCYNYEPDPDSVSILLRFKHGLARILNSTRLTQSIFGHNIIIKARKNA